MPDETRYARIHPDDWTQLDARFASVKIYTDTRVKAVEDRATDLEDKVDGDGQPGITTRLTRVETTVKLVLGVAGGALVIVGGWLLTLLPHTPAKP